MKKKMNTLKNLAVISITALSMNLEMANANYNHLPSIDFLQGRSTLTVNQGTTQRLDLGAAYKINRILVQAYSTKRPGVLNVVVNGQTKITLDIPMSDPTYYVDIYDTASSIEFVSHSGNIKVQKVIAYTDGHGTSSSVGYASGGAIGGDALDIAEYLKALMTELENEVGFDTYKNVFHPIKVKAGILVTKLRAKGLSAGESINAIEDLIKVITDANSTLESLMQRDHLFEDVMAIIESKTQLEEIVY